MNEKISVTNDDFHFFLEWMVNELDYTAKDIIPIVEKPWKWQKEYEEFIEEYYND